MFQYLLVISPGPFILVRVPMKGQLGKLRHVVAWRTLIQGLTPIMHTHGLRAKDITKIESVFHPDDSEQDFEFPKHPRELQNAMENHRNARAAFEGDLSHYPRFWLYEWQGQGFELVRQPVR